MVFLRSCVHGRLNRLQKPGCWRSSSSGRRISLQVQPRSGNDNDSKDNHINNRYHEFYCWESSKCCLSHQWTCLILPYFAPNTFHVLLERPAWLREREREKERIVCRPMFNYTMALALPHLYYMSSPNNQPLKQEQPVLSWALRFTAASAIWLMKRWMSSVSGRECWNSSRTTIYTDPMYGDN